MRAYFDKSMEQWFPLDPIIVGECSHCEEDLVKGQEVIKSEGEYFCDLECFKNYLLDTSDWHYTSMEGRDDYNDW